jgi:cell division protein FtsW
MSAVAQFYSSLKGDKAIWLIITVLGLFSMLAVYSAVGSMAYRYRGGDTESYIIQHFIFIALGGLVMYMCYKLNYMYYAKLAPILLIVTLPLLIYTIFFGAEINEARRWIQLPFTDFTFQTSDLAKLTLIIFIAKSISNRQENIKDLKAAFLPLIIPVILICGLIAPADFSTAALLFTTSIMMMFIGRVSLKYIIALLVLGVMAFSVIALLGTIFPDFIRVETWQMRIHEFLFNSDGGYQIQQSKMAIANGGIFGLGLGGSIQRNFLPSPYADFIYAIICEETGLVGGITMILLYLGLLFRCTKLVTNSPKTFGSILAMGLCLNIVIQAFANIAVSIHLVPVTGLTLPLVSMGGTSLLFTLISCGIILSVSSYVDDHVNEKKLKKAVA